MSTIKIIEHRLSVTGSANIGIIASCFNSFFVDRLRDGAIKTFIRNGIHEEDITVVKVPGAFEIPLAVDALLNSQHDYAAVITLGAIIRGETPHFEYIANGCAQGISKLALHHGIPIIFGVLTVDNAKQAMDRAGEEGNNKGSEAAEAALAMIDVLEQIRS